MSSWPEGRVSLIFLKLLLNIVFSCSYVMLIIMTINTGNAANNISNYCGDLDFSSTWMYIIIIIITKRCEYTLSEQCVSWSFPFCEPTAFHKQVGYPKNICPIICLTMKSKENIGIWESINSYLHVFPTQKVRWALQHWSCSQKPM